MLEEERDASAKTIHESVYSLAWKILLLQVLVALLSMTIIVVVWYALPVTNLTTALNFSLLSLVVCLQTLDAAILIYLVIRWRSIRYRVSTTEIAIYHGTIDVHTDIYKTANIEQIKVRQSLLGKLFNYGTVTFFYPALATNVEMVNIPNPWFYARLINPAVNSS